MKPQNPEIADLIDSDYDAASLRAVARVLAEHGTLELEPHASGLFSAATSEHDHTGYQAAWVRDNAHVANALLQTGRGPRAAATVRALTKHFERQIPRFDAVIANPALAARPSARPHVKFALTPPHEIVDWPHDQNDALGYFLWIFCRAATAGVVLASSREFALLDRFETYLEAIAYWSDLDTGHWEEARKNSASSVGTVVAGLMALRRFRLLTGQDSGLRLDRLIRMGMARLHEILPAESIAPADLHRKHDAALLFLIVPLDVVDARMRDAILEDVHQHLEGDVGIRRYRGDSFWAADYRKHVSAEERTRDFSQDLAARDQLSMPGQEAEWCIFDPVVSVVYGQRYEREGDPSFLDKQIRHFNRSLAQIDPEWRCPELWHLETDPDGSARLETSEATPLLWTQANLGLALHCLGRNLAVRDPSYG